MDDTLETWLATELEKRGWSIREAARRAGISHMPFTSILSGQGNPGLVAYKGIARAFDMPLEEVLRIAGELPTNPPPVRDEDEVLHLYRQVDPADRACLRRALRGLVANGNRRPVAVSLPAQDAHDEYESGNDSGNAAIHPHLEWWNRVSSVLSDEELRYFALRWARMVEYDNPIEADNDAPAGERANATASNNTHV